MELLGFRGHIAKENCTEKKSLNQFNVDIVVFMLSKNFIAPYKDEKTGQIDLKKQTFPEKEVMYALRHNKRLIPISIDGTSVLDCKWLEFNCSGLNCIDWNDADQHNKLIKELKQLGGQDKDTDIIENSHSSNETMLVESHPGYACLNINVNETCNIYRFGKQIGSINSGDWGKLYLQTGKHELTFVSIHNETITKVINIPSIDYTDFIHVIFGKLGNEAKDEKKVEVENENPDNKTHKKFVCVVNTIKKNKGCTITMTVAFLLFIVILPIGYFSFEGSVSEPLVDGVPYLSTSEKRYGNASPSHSSAPRTCLSTSKRRYSNELTPDAINGKKAKITTSVDLGLSSGTLWADMNIGARFVEDYGDLYSWGEIETKGDYRQSCYTDINAMSIIGTEHDVATKILGADWQLPSQAQFDELVRECLWEWKDYGFSVVGKNGNSIFLPASGWSCSSVIEHKNKYGYYWTGEKVNSTFAKELIFSKSEYKTGNGYLYYGRSIRAVKRK